MHALLKRFSWALLGRLAGALVYAVSFVLLARWTPVESFGRYSAALALVTLFQVVMDFGWSTYLIRIRAAHPEGGEAGDCLFYNNVSCLLFMGVGLVICSGLALWWGPFAVLLLPVVVWACFEKMTDVWLGVYQADGRNRDIAINVFLRRVGALLGFVGLYALGVSPLLAFGAGLAISASVAYLRVSRAIRPLLAPRAGNGLRVMLARGRPYWVNSIAVQLRTLDVFLVTTLGGATQGAYFAVANRLVTPLSMLPSSLAGVLMPSVSRGELGRAGALRAVLLMTAVASVPLLAIIVLSPFVLTFFLGEAYAASVPVLQVLCVGMVFLSASSLLIAILQGLGRASYVAGMSTVLSLLYLSSLPLAVTAGALGAALALALMFLVRSLLSWWGLRPADVNAHEAH